MTYRTDFSLSAAQLTAKGAAEAGRMTLGYIETRLRSTVSVEGSALVHPVTRRYCVRPALRVKLEFAPTTLYVAREQPEGSCEFRITMDHELQHFREYQGFLADLAEEVKADLEREFGGRIFHFDDAKAGQKQLADGAHARVQKFMQGGQEEIARRQARYDTPEEYFRLETFQAACRP